MDAAPIWAGITYGVPFGLLSLQHEHSSGLQKAGVTQPGNLRSERDEAASSKSTVTGRCKQQQLRLYNRPHLPLLSVSSLLHSHCIRQLTSLTHLQIKHSILTQESLRTHPTLTYIL
jgi:hypothetical protein